MADTVADYIQRERDRLHAEREAIFDQQRDLESKLNAINRELAAVDAYESARSGKATAPTRQARGGGTRVRRGSRRESLLALLGENREGGLSRREILERMGARGDKPGEAAISNALSALGKVGQVMRQDGRYRLA